MSAKRLDKIDFAILKLLQKNARLSNVRIAEQVGLSHSAVGHRVDALERSKVITGYHTILDREWLGFGCASTVLVQLDHHALFQTENFERALKTKFPNVLACMRLAHAWDYCLTVAAKDLAHLAAILDELRELGHVRRTCSHTALRTVFTTVVPLP